MMCRVLHMLFCGCFHATTDPNPMSTLIRLTREYQQMELDLVSIIIFHSKFAHNLTNVLKYCYSKYFA